MYIASNIALKDIYDGGYHVVDNISNSGCLVGNVI